MQYLGYNYIYMYFFCGGGGGTLKIILANPRGGVIERLTLKCDKFECVMFFLVTESSEKCRHHITRFT